MADTTPLSILFLGPQSPFAAQVESWLATCLQGPLTVHLTYRLSEALEYLHTHPVDLVLLDLTLQNDSSQDALRSLHAASPASALLALALQSNESLILDALRRGAHEALAIASASHPEACRVIARALARTGSPLPALMRASTEPAAPPNSARLIHDLNNVMTSINGFADLLLTRLAPQDPARPSAEHIRKAGERAVALLKAHTPIPGTAAPLPATRSSTITAKAA